MAIVIRCPYYRCHKDDRPNLTCEAGGLRFPSLRRRGEFMRVYCASMEGYPRCTLARMLETHYREEGA